MPKQTMQHLNVHDLIQGCRNESKQPRQQEEGYCFELFRRAVEEGDEIAWQAIDEQYRNLIIRWLNDGSASVPHEHVEEIAPETWSKFWRAQFNADMPLSDRFAHVGSILKYLKQCAVSVVKEYERQIWRRERIQQRVEGNGRLVVTFSEEELLSKIDRERLLQQIWHWIHTYVTDRQELQVLVLSYEHGLTPAEIARHYPQEFADAQTVRRLKERILKRARRAMQSERDQYRVNGSNGNGKNRQNHRNTKHRQGQKEIAND